MLAWRQRDRQRPRQVQAEHMLGIVGHAWRIAVAPTLVIFVAGFVVSGGLFVLAGVEFGLLAHFVDRGLNQRFAFVLRTRHRLPEARCSGAFHQQHLAVLRVDDAQHRDRDFMHDQTMRALSGMPVARMAIKRSILGCLPGWRLASSVCSAKIAKPSAAASALIMPYSCAR